MIEPMALDLPRALVLLTALLGMGASAPSIRFAAAPALAVVLWRLLLSLPVLCSVALWRRERWPLRPAALAGMFLAAHWLLWIAGVQRTTIATATVLVSTGVLWTSLASAPLLGERVSGRQWVGVALAVGGLVVIVLAKHDAIDLPLPAVTAASTPIRAVEHSLLGDLLALGGAFAWVGYTFVGRRARQHAGFWGYTSAVYSAATVVTALTIVATVALAGQPLLPHLRFDGNTWLALLVLAALPTLLGHGGLNYLLRYIGPARLSQWTLVEPLLATLAGWLLFGEVPGLQIALGGGTILLGILLGVGAGSSCRPTAP
jgi:drug/metabolite transporter (DMT)-like permease